MLKVVPLFNLSIAESNLNSFFREESSWFVAIKESDPALVIKFVDHNTVKGGLLKWESSMANDFKLLYTIPADIQGDFTDEKIGNYDVRVLRNENGLVMLYGFVGENIVIFSTSEEDFSQIRAAVNTD